MTCKVPNVLSKSKHNNYDEYQQKQQNIERNNTRNDTCIDRKSSSLASLWRQPPTKQSLVTK